MKSISVLIILCFAVSAFAADKTISYKNCHLTVPGDWMVEKEMQATSPDKQQVATVGSPRFIDSFAQLKQTAQSSFPKSKVTLDKADDFQMEGAGSAGKPHVYRAIPISGGAYCIGEVTYESGAADQGKKILQSLRGK